MLPKKNLFTISLYNAQSLNTCGDEFIVAVEDRSPDIVAINESWLKEGCDALAPTIPLYRLKMRPRPHEVKEGRGGGVVFIYAKILKLRS